MSGRAGGGGVGQRTFKKCKKAPKLRNQGDMAENRKEWTVLPSEITGKMFNRMSGKILPPPPKKNSPPPFKVFA